MKCPTCVRPDSKCLGERLSRLCGHPGYREYFATYREGEAAKFDRSRHEEIRLLILGCDYRGAPALECGCTKTRICLAGKGRPIPGTDLTDVMDDDCRRCVCS